MSCPGPVLTASRISAFTACVCYEDLGFGRARVNGTARESNQATALQLGWKGEMRTSALVMEMVFLMESGKQTVKDLGSDWEWGKG